MKHIFESATLRLTFMYVSILMLVCLFFSINWYRVASQELDNNFRSQQRALRNGRFRLNQQEVELFLAESREELNDAKTVVLTNIVGVNVMLIVLGGVGSYYLARKSLEPIERAHQKQIRFAADASHELRTPITAMQTEVEVLFRQKTVTKKEALNQLKSNLEELGRLKLLTNKLMRVAQLDEHSDQVTLSRFNLNTVVEEVIKNHNRLAAAKNVSVGLKDSELMDVYSDEEKVADVLSILVENAIKYSSSDGRVTVELQKSKQHVALRVSDFGEGIKREDIGKIFERFYRADSSRSSQTASGHGLGLAIASELAHQIDSKIDVESKIGKGSTFSFFVPIANSDS